MRILGIGDYGDLGDLYAGLAADGHEVRMFIADPDYHQVYSGMIERTPEWRQELDWIRAAGGDGMIVCETAHQGQEQDRLRQQGFQVIGSCPWGDRLEQDRDYAQRVLQDIGLLIAPSWPFDSFGRAIEFIRARPGRYVCKHNGSHLPSTHTYIGMLPDGADVIAVLTRHGERGKHGPPPNFILMDHVDGIETGVGAYFDGQAFVGPACLDWEHKRFFTGDLGELTGEMGTVVTYRGAERLFAETLGRMAPLLAGAGYRGYINLNTIINAQGVWPLEFTCRFGYPGFAILSALHPHGWEPVLRALCGQRTSFATAAGYAVGVVLTTPPFPYAAADGHSPLGMPIAFRGPLGTSERRHLHYGEVAMVGGQLSIAGPSGYVLVATGCGEDIADARRSAYGLLHRVVVPNGRFRTDIGERLLGGEAAMLQRLGYLPLAASAPSGTSTSR
jgi:phosphoribosylamine---glycine ligase